MRRLFEIAAVVLLVLAAVPSVQAFPISIANSGSALTASEQTELQSMLNKLYAGAAQVPNAITGQLHEGMLSLPQQASVKLTLQYEDTYLNRNSLGIFTADQATDAMGNPLYDSPHNPLLNSTTVQTVKVFQGLAPTVKPYGQVTPPVSATVALNTHNGKITVAADDPANCGGGLVDCGTVQPVTPFDFSLFGFYLYRPGDRPPSSEGVDYGTDGYLGNFWTIDQLNSASGRFPGFPEALIYKGALNSTTDRWTIAFNDIHAAQPDFNDMVFTLDVSNGLPTPAVPEPGAILLFGTAVLGSVHMLRRLGRRNPR